MHLRITYLIFAMLFFSFETQAQESNSAVHDKLFELAWKNDPESNIARSNVDIAKYNVTVSKAQWLNTVTISGNLNEFSINPERAPTERSLFYPRYNIGANIQLGLFLTIPANSKIAEEQLVVAEHLRQDRKSSLRALVSSLYNNYLMQKKIYELQSQLALDAESSSKVREQEFQQGRITYADYAASRGEANGTQIAFYQAEAAYKNAKLALEDLIGVPLETVVK